MGKNEYPIYLNVQTNCNLSFSLLKRENLIKFSIDEGIKVICLSEFNPYDIIIFNKICKENNIKFIFSIKKIFIIEEKELIISVFFSNYLDYSKFYETFHLSNLDFMFFFDKLDVSLLSLVLEPSNYEELIFALNFLKNVNKGFKSIYIGLKWFPSIDLIEENLNLLIFFFPVKLINIADKWILDTFSKLNLSSQLSYKEENNFINYKDLNNFKKFFLNNYFNIDILRKERIFEKILFNTNLFESALSTVEISSNNFNLSASRKSEKKNYQEIFDRCKEKLTYIANENNNSIDLDIYEKVLEKEMEIIKKNKFLGYFFDLLNIVDYLKEKRVVIGPGRGSASSSLVLYLLEITAIDPLKNKLYFWRFLNNKRKDIPDVDLDVFSYTEVVNLIRYKWGPNRVGRILTKQRIGWKNLIKAFYSLYPGEKYNSNIDYIANERDSFFSEENSLNSKVNYLKIKYSKLIIFASKLEHFFLSISSHPSGLVISNENLSLKFPTSIDNKGNLLITHNRENLEIINVKKFDFLNLDSCIGVIKYFRENNIDSVNYYSIPQNDLKTWKMIKNGLFSRIFQLDNRFFRKIIYNVKPHNIETLSLFIALNRPGVNISERIKWKDYKVSNLLKESMGIIVYEEQLTIILSYKMRINIPEAELVRKEIKKSLNLEKKKKIFLSFDKDLEESEKLWKFIISSSKYTYNKAHSFSYSLLVYINAYLKANYLSHYSLFFLNNYEILSNIGLIKELIWLGYTFVFPEINSSFYEWKINNEKKIIFIGISSLKFISKQFINSIIDKRKEKKYKNLEDFFKFNSDKLFLEENENSFISLLKSGVFRKISRFNFDKIEKNKIISDYLLLIKKFKSKFEYFTNNFFSNCIFWKNNRKIAERNKKEFENFSTSFSYLTRLFNYSKIENIFCGSLKDLNSLVWIYSMVLEINEERLLVYNSGEIFTLFFIDKFEKILNIKKFQEIFINIYPRKRDNSFVILEIKFVDYEKKRK